jgi:translation initiation factor 2 subunit 2
MDYDDRLERALEQTPEDVGGGDRFEVPAPTVRQEGNVTIYENFRSTTDRLARTADHLLGFLQSELGTSASIDETGRARLTGSFKRRRIADALDRYVATYVRCDECGSPDTDVRTERGATVLACTACGARSPVPE